MNPQELQKQIALYYSKLPSDAQAVFSSMTWMETLKSISIKYGLNANQIETLGTETTVLLLGIISFEDYADTLGSELGIASATIEKMLTEIHDSILKPILPTLDQAYETHVKSLVNEKYGSVEKLDERFSKLPTEVQQAISEARYQQVLYTIASAEKLSVEQMGTLEEATNKVLLGIIHPDKYEGELKDKLGLPSDKITKLVSEINEKILKNIREILKSHWNSGDTNMAKSVDDEVPLPPYKKQEEIKIDVPPTPKMSFTENPTPPAPLSKVETGIYGSVGIEVMNEKKLDDDITNSIIGNKLSRPVVSNPTTSDHSIPKMGDSQVVPPAVSKSVPPTTKHDPYHEPIE